MVRILQVVNNMHRAGLETVLMNYLRGIDKTKYQFDFLTHRSEEAAYDDEIRRIGGKIYHMPRLYPQNYHAYMREMALFFNQHPEYRIVHSHIDAMSYLPLLAAKKAGVPIRIAHSHNSGIDVDYKLPLKLLFKQEIPHVATDFFACGNQAGHFLFKGRPFFLMKNAIEVKRFAFSNVVRSEVRRELGANAKDILVGTVGRLSYQKNQEFLVDVFANVVHRRPDMKLLIIGDGENRKKIERQIHRLNLEGKIKLLGSRQDIDRIYQALDLFVLPSRFEGIPVVGIEAQAAGLPCLFSNVVSGEAVYSMQSIKLPLSKKAWISNMVKFHISEDRYVSFFGGYDIDKAIPILEKKYYELERRILEG